MKSIKKVILCAVLVSFAIGCQNTKQQSDKNKLETEKEKVSYAIGVNMAKTIERISDEIDLPTLQRGMTDSIQNKELLISKEESQSVLKAFSEKLRVKEKEEKDKLAQKNLEAGQSYLNENKTRKGVITTESGLQYAILKEGTGKSPGKSDKVKVHYKGTKLDGSEFDSSYKRGEPVTFKADRVIKGWTEGLQLMKEGGKYKLFVPADLAYGERGYQQIGPNEVLIFEIELLEVLDDKAMKSKTQKSQKTQ